MPVSQLISFDPADIVLRESDPVSFKMDVHMFKLACKTPGRSLCLQMPFWSLPFDVQVKEGEYGKFCNIAVSFSDSPELSKVCDVVRGIDARCKKLLLDFDPASSLVTKGNLGKITPHDFEATNHGYKGFLGSVKQRSDYPPNWSARVAYDRESDHIKTKVFSIDGKLLKGPVVLIPRETRVCMVAKPAYVSFGAKGISVAWFCEQIMIGAGGLGAGGAQPSFEVTDEMREEKKRALEIAAAQPANEATGHTDEAGGGADDGMDDAFASLVVPAPVLPHSTDGGAVAPNTTLFVPGGHAPQSSEDAAAPSGGSGGSGVSGVHGTPYFSMGAIQAAAKRSRMD